MTKDGKKVAVVLGLLGLVGGIIYAGTRAKAAGRRPPCGNYGDIDGDGYVTQDDANLVSHYIIGQISLSAEQIARADVNGDRMVDIRDAMLIAQYADGIIDTFPACGRR